MHVRLILLFIPIFDIIVNVLHTYTNCTYVRTSSLLTGGGAVWVLQQQEYVHQNITVHFFKIDYDMFFVNKEDHPPHYIP